MKTFLDLIKLSLAVGISAFIGKRVLSCLWELTYRCTGKCEICGYWRNPSNPKDELKLKDIKKGLGKIYAYGCRAVNFTGGEPTLRPDLEDIINHASCMGMWTSMVTNGSLLTQERVRELKNVGLDNLLVSLDSVNPQFHDRQRGEEGFYEKALECLHWLREDFLTRHRMGGIMCVLTSMNAHTVEEILEFADELGVYVVFQPYHDNKTGETKYIADISEKIISNVLYKNKQLKNVINTKSYLKGFPNYYRNESIPACHAGLKYFSIDPFGFLHPCVDTESVGHLFKDDISVIKSERAQRNVRSCSGCWYSFRAEADSTLSFRGYLEKVRLGLSVIFRNASRKRYISR